MTSFSATRGAFLFQKSLLWRHVLDVFFKIIFSYCRVFLEVFCLHGSFSWDIQMFGFVTKGP